MATVSIKAPEALNPKLKDVPIGGVFVLASDPSQAYVRSGERVGWNLREFGATAAPTIPISDELLEAAVVVAKEVKIEVIL